MRFDFSGFASLHRFGLAYFWGSKKGQYPETTKNPSLMKEAQKNIEGITPADKVERQGSQAAI